MGATATVTTLPTPLPSNAVWVPVAGKTYNLTPINNESFFNVSGIDAGGLASVSGAGTGAPNGAGWELAYNSNSGQWLVHNGADMGGTTPQPQTVYYPYALQKPLLGGSGSGALSTAGPIGLGTVGEEVAVIAVVVIVIVIIAIWLHVRK